MSEKILRKTETQTTTPHDSTTEVIHVLSEPRKTVSFKCNKKLWKTFVDYSKANYGSVCHILEPVMYAILHSKVILSRTIEASSQPVIIENLNIVRSVKRVRRYVSEVETVSSDVYCAMQNSFIPVDGRFLCLSMRMSCPNTKCFEFVRGLAGHSSDASRV